MYCLQCGNQIPEGAGFCSVCGAPAAASLRSASAPAVAPAQILSQPVSPAQQPMQSTPVIAPAQILTQPAPQMQQFAPGQPYIQPALSAIGYRNDTGMTLRVCSVVAAFITVILGIILGNMNDADRYAPHFFGSGLNFWLSFFPLITFALLLARNRNSDLIAVLHVFCPVLQIVITAYKDLDRFRDFLKATSQIMSTSLPQLVVGIILILICLSEDAISRRYCNIVTLICVLDGASNLFGLFYFLAEGDEEFACLYAVALLLLDIAHIFMAMAFKMERDSRR